MSPEDITPSPQDKSTELLWKYPKFQGKIALRVSVDWTGVQNPGPNGEYKLMGLRENREGQVEGEVMIPVDGQPKRWWVPVDNIHNNED